MANKRISIMIVDDNDMMRGMLRGEAFDVIGEARNGVIAVEMAERLKPDIVCLDVVMPEKMVWKRFAKSRLQGRKPKSS